MDDENYFDINALPLHVSFEIFDNHFNFLIKLIETNFCIIFSYINALSFFFFTFVIKQTLSII